MRLCAEHHAYWLGDQRLESVTKVIKSVLPADYAKVDPVILECARLRGSFIDTYFCEWLSDPNGVLSPAEIAGMIEPGFAAIVPAAAADLTADTVQRINRLLDWWSASKLQAISIQRTVFSERDGVAGTFDLATEDMIFDLKCVSKLQPNYGLQLGAYLTMDDQKFPIRGGAVINVTKEKVRLVTYNAKQCKDQWRSCIGWYRTMKELNG